MVSASIKLTNLHYFEALQQLALTNLPQLTNNPKLLILPFYNFVCTFVEILVEFSKSSNSFQHPHQDLFNLNSYLVDFYVLFCLNQFRKYQTNPSEIYRQLFSFLRSWKKYTEHHQEAKLFVSLLTPERNTVDGAKLFLKFRKCILKSLNQKILQQLPLTHCKYCLIFVEDALTITHTLFSHNQELKSYVTKKINELFISLKMKLINSAKVNGAVMCEFFMACSERFSQLDINKLFGEKKPERKKIVRNVSNTKVKKQSSPSPLKQKNQNLIANPQNNPKPNEIKYNLSFSEEFASYYSPQTDHIEEFKQKNIQHEQPESKFMSNFEELQNQWKIKGNENEAPINLVRNSLNFFKQKDHQIDMKLNNCKKYHFNQNHNPQSHVSNELNENVSFPEGWQNFIRTNAKTKKKLMSHRKPIKLQEDY